MRVFSSRILCSAAVGAFAFAAASFAQAEESQTINVLLANDQTTSLHGAFAAEELGFFEAEGITVNILSSATTVPYVAFLANGDADLVMLDSAQVFQAVDAQQPISVVYEVQQFASEAIVVKDDSPIQGLSELKGTTIGLAGDRDQITTIVALKSVGLSIDDVRTAVVGDSGPILAKSLTDGTIDAFAGSAPDLAAIEGNGIKIRNITPRSVSENPGNSFVIWNPRKEELREGVTKFLRGWAMAVHAGVIDTPTMAAISRKRVPEQWEDPKVGFSILDTAVYKTNLIRTRLRGEPQPDVWDRVQAPYIELGEMSQHLDPATFLDDSFIEGANDYKTAQVKEAIAKWKEANKDILFE